MVNKWQSWRLIASLGFMLLLQQYSVAQKLNITPELGGQLVQVKPANSSYIFQNPTVAPHIGIKVNYQLFNTPFYVGTGLYYERFSNTFQTLPNVATGTVSTIRLNYFRLPLNLSYKYMLPNGAALIPQIGIWLMYGFNGGITTYHKDSNTSDSVLRTDKSTLTWGNKTTEVNPVSVGGRVGLSYQWAFGLSVHAQYNRTFTAIHIPQLGDMQYSFTSLGVGYCFKRK